MAKSKTKHDTPAMRQFRAFKKQHPNCVLFFRMGDFYELFYDDAKLAHKVLGVTLTQRTEGIPMAGVPYHSVEGYLRKMIQAGYRVAVCEQMEDPAQAQGVVKRDVTRVITPGTLTDEAMLEEGRENPLAAVMFHGDQKASVAWAELSTGAFSIATFEYSELADELARVAPRELLYVETANGAVPERIQALADVTSCALAGRPGWQFRQDEAVETLHRQYQVATLAGFGIEEDDPALGPASAVIHYLLETQKATGGEGPRASGLGSREQDGQDTREGNGQRGNNGSTSLPSSRGPRPETRGPSLAHLQPPRRFERSRHLVIDSVSLRSLEIERTLRSGEVAGSVLGVLQGCVTAMGKRMLRQWLCYPLCDQAKIEQRQRVVAALVEDGQFRDDLRAALDEVQDIERICGRIAVGRATPRDLVALGRSSRQVRALVVLLADRPGLARYYEEAQAVAATLDKLSETVLAACDDDPPAHLREGGLIRDGYDAQLDEARSLQRDSHTWLATYQKELVDQTAIPSLKVGFNKVFGYYIEVTASQRDKAPDAWSRKQTLKNAERFITPELKEFEGKVLSAESRAVAREQELFAQLCAMCQEPLEDLRRFARLVAGLDVMACFAERAVRHRYVCPRIVDHPVLDIDGGRHVVLDELLGDRFVPNDVGLSGPRGSGLGPREEEEDGGLSDLAAAPQGDSSDETAAPEDTAGQARHGTPDPASRDPRPEARGPSPSLALITGPNMAGKSTYIRQAALITLLAHTGSFVPADRAVVGLCDRIFTRIGASDELHTGQSTFMVEMTETANICNHATTRSLVILDEIGRGTSTLDGLSLAWAIAEHLAAVGCRTLFATHYHEITSLAERFDNVGNLNVAVREWQDQIVFLHRIVPGATGRSYGIHVAKIAGVPQGVIERANELMARLEVSHDAGLPVQDDGGCPRVRPNEQLSLFTEYVDHPALETLRQAKLDAMSPMQAFDLLRQLREQVDGKG